MGRKTKDCVFALLMMVVGIYVIYESNNMLARVARAPYRITEFRISPAMLPMVLGCGLIVFCLFLLASSIKGGGENSIGRHLATAMRQLGKAVRDRDMISMTVCALIMFIFTFFVIGLVPYWLGSVMFLILLMSYLRASAWWLIALTSGVSVALIILLFQIVFRTTLP